MKKLLVLGMIVMLSVLVSAGEYPDTDDDGICEYPFCGQIDLCPKAACEQLGFPIEVCQQKTGDRDNDGVGDACDACPTNSDRFEEPCGRRGQGGGSGGGGGATGAGCRSTTNYNGALHQTNGWGCITDNDCHNTANKLNLNPADYACVITSVREIQNIVANTCMCASVLKAPGAVGGTGAASQTVQPTEAAPYSGSQARDATVRSPPARTRQPVGTAFSQPPPVAGGTSGVPVGLLAGLGVLLAAGAGLYLYTRPKKRR